jgi:VWFA-related protein
MNKLHGCWLRGAARIVLVGTLLTVAGVGLRPQCARAQGAAQGADVIVTIDEVDDSDFPTIRLRVGVRDRTGVPIPDLTADNFEIIEDGATAFSPSSVSMESSTSAQVSLAIVVDLYKSLAGRPIEAAQEATNALLGDLLGAGNSQNRAAFVGVHKGISTDPKVINEGYEVPFSSDGNRMLNVINFVHERMEDEPGTPLYDAVVKAVRMAAATEPVGHRAVIVMTDGEDRTSTSTDSDTIQTAIGQRTPVFTIGLSNSRLNEQYLRRLADQTGGTYQTAQSPDDFSSQFANVLTNLRTQYVLVYDATLPEDGLPHSLLVHVRTPTQTEGFAEHRLVTPGEALAPTAEEEEPEDALTTTPLPTEAATPVASPEPEPEGGLVDTITSFVQDNLLLTILIVAALALLFLIVLIVVIIIIRRRRLVDEEELPPVPEASFGSQPYGAPQAGMGNAGDFGAPTDLGAPTNWPDRPYAPAPDYSAGGVTAPPTQAAGVPPASPFGVATTTAPGGSATPAPPPPFAAPVAQPRVAAAGGTQILDRSPKMPVVGLLIARQRPNLRFDVSKPVVTIGRTQGSDVVIDDGTISRQHATIKWEDDRFRVYDLGSSNGTFVGDQRVRAPIELEDGAVVRFGAVEMVFKVVSLNA